LNVAIRRLARSDLDTWVKMRQALWPEPNLQTHAAEIEEMLGCDDMWAFVAESDGGEPLGFAELAIRPYANGCDSRPIPFLEGIWVDPAMRRHSVGARLIAYVEAFLTARGFSELGSDTPIENHGSQIAHRGWGFEETERVVYFRKRFSCE